MSHSILMITTEFDQEIVGGLGIVATKLTRHLVDRGYQLTVITLNRKDDKVKKKSGKIIVYQFPKNAQFYQNRQMVASEIARYINVPDLIHLQSVQGLELAKYLKSKHGTPIVYTSHSMGIVESEVTERDRSETNKQQEEIYELVDAIICPSRMERKRLIHYYPHLVDKVHVIPNGIDRNKIKPKRKIIPNRILYVGRVARSKGLETLIRALPKVIKKRPKTILHVVGSGSSSYMGEMRQLISQLKLKQKVIFHPWMDQDELSRYYRGTTIVVIPSHYESFGMVVVEALAHATPVIVTTAVGAAEDMSRSVIIKVEPKNHSQLSDALIHLLSSRSSLIERGKNGYKIAKQYSWEYTSDKYIDLYQRLISNLNKETSED